MQVFPAQNNPPAPAQEALGRGMTPVCQARGVVRRGGLRQTRVAEMSGLGTLSLLSG